MALGIYLLIHMVLANDLLKADDITESGVFHVVYNDKSFKLSTNEQIDSKFLGQIFNVKPDDIIGFERQDGLLIRLSNNQLPNLVNDKVVALKVVDNSQNDMDTCQTSSTYQNVSANHVEIITFNSGNDSGQGAIKKMEDWLHNMNNKDIVVVDIKSNYFTIGQNGHYWWHVIYSRK